MKNLRIPVVNTAGAGEGFSVWQAASAADADALQHALRPRGRECGKWSVETMQAVVNYVCLLVFVYLDMSDMWNWLVFFERNVISFCSWLHVFLFYTFVREVKSVFVCRPSWCTTWLNCVCVCSLYMFVYTFANWDVYSIIIESWLVDVRIYIYIQICTHWYYTHVVVYCMVSFSILSIGA